MIALRARRFLIRLAEKAARRWYEGPALPARFAEMVRAFAGFHPTATRRAWMEFAEELAGEAYRSGWARGYQHAERDPDEPNPTPEQIADATLPGWRDREHDFSWDSGAPAPTGLDLVVVEPDERAVVEEHVRSRSAAS